MVDIESNENYKQWLISQGKLPKLGLDYKSNVANGDVNSNKILIDHRTQNKYDDSSGRDSDLGDAYLDYVKKSGRFGSSSTKMNVNDGKANDVNVRFGTAHVASFELPAEVRGDTVDLQTQKKTNLYGASDQTKEDFQTWLQSQNKYGGSSSGINIGDGSRRHGTTQSDLGDAYQDWLVEKKKLGNAIPDEWLMYQEMNKDIFMVPMGCVEIVRRV